MLYQNLGHANKQCDFTGKCQLIVFGFNDLMTCGSFCVVFQRKGEKR